ncbi:hypothetical protein PCANC_08395 [Puccinia coronata f. sp. avenae]|uniref:Uncharacterized protein n=1 Tax=Puccinia coronata f. sp. avenae TaxID=200324 RepID=A0A2N5V6M3_9BASI|nr:hypothetical protein PCANC_08395 [Puccinia coronata f. sp. avenae]
MATSLLLPPAQILSSNEESDSHVIHSNKIASKDISFSEISDPFILEMAAQQLSGSKPRITLPKKLLALPCEELKDHIREIANGIYSNNAKDQQIDTVSHLVHSKHTFILANTWFRKTQIAKIYWKLFKPYQKPVIFVLNPLDSLGDNQVR